MGRVSEEDIVWAARAEGVSPALLKALVNQESGGRTDAVSPAGAFGPTQLMPGTAAGLGVNRGSPPRALLRAGARYFKQQLDRFGDVKLALAAYNAGPGAVERHGGIPPYRETQHYVQTVYGAYKAGGGTGSGRASQAAGAARDVQQNTIRVESSTGTPATPPERLSGGQMLGALDTLKQQGTLAFAQQVAGMKAQLDPGRAGTDPSFQVFQTSKPAGGSAPRDGGANAGAAAGAVQWARNHVGGFPESQGPNRGPGLDALQAKFGFTGAAWCAMFVTQAAVHGGMDRAGKSASVAQIRRWASMGSNGYEKGLRPATAGNVKPGDLITFGDAHVGLVESVGADGIRTIEGNTSAGRVARRVRPFGDGQIARPRYGGRNA
jgi:hypothetical protein